MGNRLKFNKIYFAFTISLFIVEILIALYVHDSFVRPYIGDFLVVILIYCFVKSFLNIPVFAACLYVLIFSYLVEILQYFKIVEILHLQDFKFARIIIGTSFAWMDIIAYTAGIGLTFIIEKTFNYKLSKIAQNPV